MYLVLMAVQVKRWGTIVHLCSVYPLPLCVSQRRCRSAGSEPCDVVVMSTGLAWIRNVSPSIAARCSATRVVVCKPPQCASLWNKYLQRNIKLHQYKNMFWTLNTTKEQHCATMLHCEQGIELIDISFHRHIYMQLSSSSSSRSEDWLHDSCSPLSVLHSPFKFNCYPKGN